MSFENAPVSKGFMIWSAVVSILFGIFDLKHHLHLQLVPHISRHHQYWRLFIHHLACTSFSDLFIAELTLYHIGVHVERLFGSVKFASFALVSVLLSTIFEFSALLLLNGLGFNYIPPGHTALLFSMLYQYSRLVPSIYHFRIFGASFNNKIFTYVFVAQLSISHPPGSFVAALIGILSGQIYRSDLFNLKTYRLPPWIIHLTSRFLLPLLGSLRPPRRTNRALPDDRPAGPGASSAAIASLDQDEPITTAQTAAPTAARRDGASTTSVMRDWVNELTGSGDRTGIGLRVPTETEINQVTAMFPNVGRETVVGALQRSPTTESAIETLLSTQS